MTEDGHFLGGTGKKTQRHCFCTRRIPCVIRMQMIAAVETFLQAVRVRWIA